MNEVLKKMKAAIESNRKLYLPHVKDSDLENDGAIYYMNGKDGTEFDWYVNEKLPPFMMFYNDEANLGAVKGSLYRDGKIAIFLYDEKGKKLIREVYADLEVNETEVFKLAVILKNEADENHLWGEDLECVNTDIELSDETRKEFQEHKKYYTELINKKNILNLQSVVSKKITEEGFKAGYMERNEPHDEEDSGWVFLAGNEEEKYLSDHRNLECVSVGNVWRQFDPDIFNYIDMPVGARLIRISPEAFEIDRNDKEIYKVKR